MNFVHVVSDVGVEVCLQLDDFLTLFDDVSKLCVGLGSAVSLVSGVIHGLHRGGLCWRVVGVSDVLDMCKSIGRDPRYVKRNLPH